MPDGMTQLSVQCAGLVDLAPTHDCDGTAFGNAGDDQAFMESLPPGRWTCECECHKVGPDPGPPQHYERRW